MKMNYKIFIWASLLLCFLIACKNSSDRTVDHQTGPFALMMQDSVNIAYTVHGIKSDQSTLVFVHGWSCDQTYWRKQVDHFKSDRQVVTIDLAGHGTSDKGSRTNFSIDNFARDVNQVIDHLALDDYILLGHSMGTMVVLTASAKQNESLSGVVAVDYLFDTLRPMPEEEYQQVISPFEADFFEVTKQFVYNGMFRQDADSLIREQVALDMASAPKDVAISAIASLLKTDFSDILSEVVASDIPRFIINADNNPTNKKYLSDGLGFEVNIIPETNHFFMIEKPDQTNSIIRQITESKR